MASVKKTWVDPGPKTGWPPGMLQDDSKKLSRWLSSRIDSMRHAREAAEAILEERKKSGGHPSAG